MKDMYNDYVIDIFSIGKRIDKYVSELYSDISRTYIQQLIQEHHILVNSKGIKPNYKLTLNDKVSVHIPKVVEPDIVAENIALDILYEDEDIIVVNKPKQMVVHPARGHYTGTLVNALMYHCKDNLSGINGISRPGIVHRIDCDTTGALVVCKNDFAHNHIAEQLKAHSITRKYIAIVHNVIKEDYGTVNATIGRHPINRLKMEANVTNGKEAVTHYRVLDRYKNFTYIECTLETGRTHQIRVHMSSIGYPLLGDVVYGPSHCPYKLVGQTLHARVLGFVHPRTNQYMEFEAPIPEYFLHLLKILPRN